MTGDVVLLNTTCLSCSSGSASGGTVQYSLLSPQYTMIVNNCNITISYTLQKPVIVEVIVRSNDDRNISITNLTGTIGDMQTCTVSLALNESIVQLIFSITSDLNDVLLLIDDVKLSNCFDQTSSIVVESSVLLMMESTSSTVISTNSITPMLSTTMSSVINTADAVSMVQSTSSTMNISSTDMSSISTPTSTVVTTSNISTIPSSLTSTAIETTAVITTGVQSSLTVSLNTSLTTTSSLLFSGEGYAQCDVITNIFTLLAIISTDSIITLPTNAVMPSSFSNSKEIFVLCG